MERTIHDEISLECTKLKVSFTELCERAGVPYGSLGNWRYKNPKSIVMYKKLMATLEELKQEKSQPNE
jgi:hypothetical protein